MDGNERSISEKGEGSGAMHVTRVMTDEQMELLRRQISVYATICEQLVEMHKSLTTRQDPLNGMRLGSNYSDPLMTPGGHRISGRQRWTPTIGQLQILEKIFEQDNGAPSKQKIKQIASELSQHGQISETNVYNWFQNRRARSKRKQTAASSNTESEFEAEAESSDEKRAKLEKMYSHESEPPRIENASSQSREITPEGHGKNPELKSVDSSRSSESPGLMSLNENALSSSNMNQPPDGKDGHSSGEHYYFSARRGIT